MSPRSSRAVGCAVALAAITLSATGCRTDDGGAAAATETAARPAASGATPAPLSLGAGFLAFPDAASAWVDAHPTDYRTPRIRTRIASQPTALWLTGDESFGNLSTAVRLARKTDRTMVLSLYNIPLRWDGLSDPSSITLTEYKKWIDRVATSIGTTRAVVVLEPDALWFYDRLPSDADRAVRISALTYAVRALASTATRTRVYLDAGTSSGSVTPQRMAALLVQAGLGRAAGYAVNTSSYSPSSSIRSYAQAVRTALRSRGVADPRYVTDTGRNGAAAWDNDWCNPTGQQLGLPPALLGLADGRDLNLWVKAPGTSDGDCGPPGGGQGTYGGEFIPALAYQMSGP